MAKIDYCLPFYGNCPATYLKKLKANYHSALRLAFGAFRTTPINNLLFEAQLMPIELRFEMSIAKMCKSLLFSANTPIQTILQKIKKSIRRPRLQSVLRKAFQFSKDNGTFTPPIKPYKQKTPPWFFSKDTVNLSLHYTTKAITPPTVYQQKFISLKENFHNYGFIYTDGSKSAQGVSYSVTTETTVIKTAILPTLSSIYTAEVAAIYAACKYADKQKKKVVICSDSLSAVTSVTNTNNQSFYTVRIRDILNRHQPKIILLWIPGHNNIPGNDTADLAAKEAHKFPQVMECNYNFTDTQLFIKNTFKKQMESIWQNASNHYKYFNEKKLSIKDYTIPSEDNINRRDLTKFLRLRFGHTRYTHEHVLNKQPPPQCEHCSTRNNVRHFFLECPVHETSRSNTLSIKSPDALSPKSTNIASANVFIKAIRLYNNI